MKIRKIAELKGHTGSVYALSAGILPHTFLSGGSDRYLAQWDLLNPGDAQAIAQLPGLIYSICPVPGSETILVGEASGGLHLVYIGQKTPLKSLLVHSRPVFDICLLPGNRQFVSVSSDGTLALCDVQSLSVIKKIKLCEEKVRAVDLHPSGTEIAVACGDESIRIIELATFQEIKNIKAHQHSVYTVRYDPLSARLLSGARDAHLNIYDSAAGYGLLESIPAHNFAIYDIRFSPDNKYFATASRDKSLKIWDRAGNTVLARISKDTHLGHANSVNKLYWDAESGLLVSAGDDRMPMIWEIQP